MGSHNGQCNGSNDTGYSAEKNDEDSLNNTIPLCRDPDGFASSHSVLECSANLVIDEQTSDSSECSMTDEIACKLLLSESSTSYTGERKGMQYSTDSELFHAHAAVDLMKCNGEKMQDPSKISSERSLVDGCYISINVLNKFEQEIQPLDGQLVADDDDHPLTSWSADVVGDVSEYNVRKKVSAEIISDTVCNCDDIGVDCDDGCTFNGQDEMLSLNNRFEGSPTNHNVSHTFAHFSNNNANNFQPSDETVANADICFQHMDVSITSEVSEENENVDKLHQKSVEYEIYAKLDIETEAVNSIITVELVRNEMSSQQVIASESVSSCIDTVKSSSDELQTDGVISSHFVNCCIESEMSAASLPTDESGCYSSLDNISQSHMTLSNVLLQTENITKLHIKKAHNKLSNAKRQQNSCYEESKFSNSLSERTALEDIINHSTDNQTVIGVSEEINGLERRGSGASLEKFLVPSLVVPNIVTPMEDLGFAKVPGFLPDLVEEQSEVELKEQSDKYHNSVNEVHQKEDHGNCNSKLSNESQIETLLLKSHRVQSSSIDQHSEVQDIRKFAAVEPMCHTGDVVKPPGSGRISRPNSLIGLSKPNLEKPLSGLNCVSLRSNSDSHVPALRASNDFNNKIRYIYDKIISRCSI